MGHEGGELWLVEDKRELIAERFEYLEGQATLVVTGELSISPDIDPKVLAEGLAKVHNLGRIKCTPGQMGAIQARLGMSDGDLVDSARKKKSADEDSIKDDTARIGNVGYLAL